MVRADATEAQWRLHLQQLTSMQYHQKLTVMRAESKLCAHAADVLLDAFDLDLKVSQTHAKTVTFPSPGAVLVTMMDKMQRERAASAQAKAKLDQNPGSSTAIASHNGCSAENVGTHTLMSKDATSKEPMRPEAVALAKHASAGVARTLSAARRPSRTPRSRRRLGLRSPLLYSRRSCRWLGERGPGRPDGA